MKELLTIQQKLNAPKGQFNAFGKYRYRSCEDILAAVKPLLGETGTTLTLSDEIIAVGNRIYVKATATLMNEKGEKEIVTALAREEETKKGMDGSQITGASSSYARKYALNGLFSIDDTADSDATNDHGQGDNADEKKAIKEVEAAKTRAEAQRIWANWQQRNPSICVKGGKFYDATAKKIATLPNETKSA